MSAPVSPERALLDALAARLAADAGVKATLGDPARVFLEKPRKAAYPFAYFGAMETRGVGASLSPALEHAVTLHLWSRTGARLDAVEALAAARRALDDAALTLDGRRLVFLYAGYGDVFDAADPLAAHAVLRLRAITEPA